MKCFKYLLLLCSTSALANGQEDVYGRWKSVCFPFFKVFQQETLVFKTEGAMAIDRVIYQDASCSVPLYRVAEDLSYELGEADADGSRVYNANVLTVRLTPLSDEQVQVWKDNAYCRSTDWAIHESRDVLGLTCSQTLAGVEATENYHFEGAPAYSRLLVTKHSLSIAWPLAKQAKDRPSFDPKKTYTYRRVE